MTQLKKNVYCGRCKTLTTQVELEYTDEYAFILLDVLDEQPKPARVLVCTECSASNIMPHD